MFSNLVIDLFTDKAAMLNLSDLRSIMGCPGGYSLSIYALSSGKERTSLYISWKKGDHYYIQARHNDLFSHYNLFKGKLKEKLTRKARVNTDRVYRIVLTPSGHPMTHLKSSLFNMAAVSVKRYIHLHFTVRFKSNRVQFFANCALDNIHAPYN